jgi:hypothetical protein
LKTFLPVAALLMSLALSACGSASAGDSCSPENSATCSSNTEALWCEQGKFRAVPCSGANGCSETNGQLACDFSRAKAGDACPANTEGKAQCATGFADQALKCTSGTWTALTCKSCSVQNGQVTCVQ